MEVEMTAETNLQKVERARMKDREYMREYMREYRARKRVEQLDGDPSATTPDDDPSALMPLKPVQPPSAMDPDFAPPVKRNLYAPQWEAVRYHAKTLDIPEEYARNWYDKMASQDWFYMNRGQPVKITLAGWKAVFQRFYEIDSKKSQDGAPCTELRAPIGDHAVTRAEFEEYVARYNDGAKYPLLKEDVDNLWDILKMMDFHTKSGILITKVNCGANLTADIKAIKRDKIEAEPEKDEWDIREENENSQEFKETEYLKNMEHHLNLVKHWAKECRNPALTPKERFQALQFYINKKNHAIKENYLLGKTILRFEGKGQKWTRCQPMKLDPSWKLTPSYYYYSFWLNPNRNKWYLITPQLDGADDKKEVDPPDFANPDSWHRSVAENLRLAVDGD